MYIFMLFRKYVVDSTAWPPCLEGKFLKFLRLMYMEQQIMKIG